MRQILRFALLSVGACTAVAAAAAYPEKPVRVIVPVPAGGTPDVVARMVLPGLSAALGQQLVVDNRGGAGGLIGAELAAKAVPDGYTLFFSSPGALVILPHLQKQAAYDTLRDFAPVSLVSIGPFLLIAHPSLPAKSVKELLALAKAEPGKFNYASAGNGAANHLAMELFKSLSGASLTHVPYKGAPQAVTDLIGGSGVSGVPGYESITWFGLLAPMKTPAAIVSRLNELLVKVVHTPEMKAQFEMQGYDPVGGSAAEFSTFIRGESEKYGRVVKSSGAKVD